MISFAKSPFILSFTAVAFALAVLACVSTGTARAGSPRECKGPTKSSVISCCQREMVTKTKHMIGAYLSCREAVVCGGKASRERCKVEIQVLLNPSHETTSSRKTRSDIRLKTNIHRVGTTVMNLPLYSFEYRGKHGTYIGVMAQDVLKVEPSAVSVGDDGFYRVDYQKLGIDMLQVQ